MKFYEYQDTAGTWQCYQSFMINENSGGKTFLKLQVNAKCKVYFVRTLNTGATVMGGVVGAALAGPDTAYFIQMGTSDAWPIKQHRFKKDMAEFFQHYPKMTAAINTGGFTIDNWEAMILYFNSNFEN